LIFTREELLDTLPMLKQRREEGQGAGARFARVPGSKFQVSG
jgi:hypothetical protein